jgi:hypothetical protein
MSQKINQINYLPFTHEVVAQKNHFKNMDLGGVVKALHQKPRQSSRPRPRGEVG